MKVILRKDVAKLGRTGDIIQVKDGYARNYLFPGNVAMLATDANIRKVELEKKKQLQELEAKRKELKVLADKLSGVSVNIESEATEEDKLYGAISAAQISAALEKENFPVDKDWLVLSEPIKALGIYEISVNMAPEIETKIKVWVVRK